MKTTELIKVGDLVNYFGNSQRHIQCAKVIRIIDSLNNAVVIEHPDVVQGLPTDNIVLVKELDRLAHLVKNSIIK